MRRRTGCNGTTTLLAAPNVLTGEVMGQNMQRHRHQDVLAFLARIEKSVPKSKTIHVVIDSVSSHVTLKSWHSLPATNASGKRHCGCQ